MVVAAPFGGDLRTAGSDPRCAHHRGHHALRRNPGRCPVAKAPFLDVVGEAGFVPEGDEIPANELDSFEAIIAKGKIAILTKISREQYKQTGVRITTARVAAGAADVPAATRSHLPRNFVAARRSQVTARRLLRRCPCRGTVRISTSSRRRRPPDSRSRSRTRSRKRRTAAANPAPSARKPPSTGPR